MTAVNQIDGMPPTGAAESLPFSSGARAGARSVRPQIINLGANLGDMRAGQVRCFDAHLTAISAGKLRSF